MRKIEEHSNNNNTAFTFFDNRNSLSDRCLVGLNAIVHAIQRNADRRDTDSAGQPQGGDKKKTQFQDRMNRFAESFIQQEASSEEPPTTLDVFTLGPLTESDRPAGERSERLKAEPSIGGMTQEIINWGSNIKDSDKKVEGNTDPTEGCLQMNAALDGEELDVKKDVVDVAACRSVCRESSDCQFFSYASTLKECVLFNRPTSLEKAEGVLSGPSNCSSLPSGMNSFNFAHIHTLTKTSSFCDL